MLSERGIDISNETVRRWFLKFGRLIAGNVRSSRPWPSASWHLDETVIKIRGRKHWLWRAVDDEGEVPNFLVQRRRCARSARRLLRKLLKKPGFAPKRITTDKLKSYPSPSAMSGFRPSTIRGCGQTIGLKIPTNGFDDESENNSGSSLRDQPNASWQYALPSRTPSTFNATSCHATSSNNFELMRLLPGSRVGLSPDLDHNRILANEAVNVSTPTNTTARVHSEKLRKINGGAIRL